MYVYVCMYVYSACTCGSARTITIERKHALAGTNINFNIDDHFRLEMVVNIEIQILYGSWFACSWVYKTFLTHLYYHQADSLIIRL